MSHKPIKATHIDRDDFDADHYADLIRDIHRSRLIADQLDIAKRQLQRKEKLLTRIHGLKMKEHTRVKNDFIRKVEQDQCLANLPKVQQTLQAERRKHSEPIPSETSPESTEKPIDKHERQQQAYRAKKIWRPNTPRTERLKANWNEFNHMKPLLF